MIPPLALPNRIMLEVVVALAVILWVISFVVRRRSAVLVSRRILALMLESESLGGNEPTTDFDGEMSNESFFSAD